MLVHSRLLLELCAYYHTKPTPTGLLHHKECFPLDKVPVGWWLPMETFSEFRLHQSRVSTFSPLMPHKSRGPSQIFYRGSSMQRSQVPLFRNSHFFEGPSSCKSSPVLAVSRGPETNVQSWESGCCLGVCMLCAAFSLLSNPCHSHTAQSW